MLPANDAAPPPAWRHYRVAGRAVAMDCELPALASYCLARPVTGDLSRPPARVATTVALTREVEGLVGGALQRVAVSHAATGTWLEIPGLARLWVAADGSRVSLVTAPPGVDASVLEETVLGPGLILALACQGTYCLHASAVQWAGRALVFVGDSGAGKSTLAALLRGGGGGDWLRLADDILPLGPAEGAAQARPDFPQLKLPPEEPVVATGAATPSSPLAAVYELAGPAAEAPDLVTIQALSPRQTALTLLTHTVANRLFPEAVARRHFHDLVALAGQVPVRRLCYPRRLDIGPAVAAALAADLAPPAPPATG